MKTLILFCCMILFSLTFPGSVNAQAVRVYSFSLPAYEFGIDRDHVITRFIDSVDSISFLIKGTGLSFSPQNELKFYYRANGEDFSLFKSFDSLPVNSTGMTIPVNRFSGNIKIEFTGVPGGGNLIMKDLKIYSTKAGINDEMAEDPVTVFPSPTNGPVNIKILPGSGKPEVEVYDIIGNKISYGTLERKGPGHYTFDISNCNKGFYFVKIRSGYQFVTKRITLSD